MTPNDDKAQISPFSDRGSVKTYTITRSGAGVSCQANDNAAGPKRNGSVTAQLAGIFCTGDASKGSKDLAAAIMSHYYGDDQAEAARKAEPFRDAFLAHHKMNAGARLVITSDVIDSWIARS